MSGDAEARAAAGNPQPPSGAVLSEHADLLRTARESGKPAVSARSDGTTAAKRFQLSVAIQDRPGAYSAVLSLLWELGVNIVEAHAFTREGVAEFQGLALQLFLLDGWEAGHIELLAVVRELLQKLDAMLEGVSQRLISRGAASRAPAHVDSVPSTSAQAPAAQETIERRVSQETGADSEGDWEINTSMLRFTGLVGTGSNGKVYRGTYAGQEVAIKVLKHTAGQEEAVRDFVQELRILRRVRHRNIVQLIGASLVPPKLCIVTEFLRCGSLQEHLLRSKGPLKPHVQAKLALDVAQGMDYMHRNNIIHRDLKAANLLMNEHGECKVCDFGVARNLDTALVMTAETGTYRWMAPEVVAHQPYDAKCDVYSYGIVLWEMATGGSVPYAGLSPLQAAVGVVQKGLRPPVPAGCHPALARLMTAAWAQQPAARPHFGALVTQLEALMAELREADGSGVAAVQASSNAASSPGGFFARMRRK